MHSKRRREPLSPQHASAGNILMATVQSLKGWAHQCFTQVWAMSQAPRMWARTRRWRGSRPRYSVSVRGWIPMRHRSVPCHVYCARSTFHPTVHVAPRIWYVWLSGVRQVLVLALEDPLLPRGTLRRSGGRRRGILPWRRLGERGCVPSFLLRLAVRLHTSSSLLHRETL